MKFAIFKIAKTKHTFDPYINGIWNFRFVQYLMKNEGGACEIQKTKKMFLWHPKKKKYPISYLLSPFSKAIIQAKENIGV